MASLKHFKIDYNIGGKKRLKEHKEFISPENAIKEAREVLNTKDVDEVYLYAPIKVVRLKDSPIEVKDIDMSIDEDVKIEITPPTSGSSDFTEDDEVF